MLCLCFGFIFMLNLFFSRYLYLRISCVALVHVVHVCFLCSYLFVYVLDILNNAFVYIAIKFDLKINVNKKKLKFETLTE